MPKNRKDRKSELASTISVKKPTDAVKAKDLTKSACTQKSATPQSRSDRVLTLLRQSGGASLDELMTATKWQAHSVRGFLSGAVKKRKGLMVMSTTDGEGTRRYRIEAGQGA